MKIKALVSFSGVISMTKGETANIENEELTADLLQAGYIKITEPEGGGSGDSKENNENK